MKESMFYEILESKSVRCELCPHYCIIKENSSGICKVRKNVNGKLYSINYGYTVSFGIDPIEKKPLYHFYPGEKTLSLATTSCNFNCKFCQNYEISQNLLDGSQISVSRILNYCLQNHIKIVSFTYTEPTIWYEFIYDVSKILQEYNIKIVLVTNGFINPGPLKLLAKYINAMNIDLKAFNDNFYKKFCNGSLSPVLSTIKLAHKLGIHIEITNLLITDLNDNIVEFKQLVDFIRNLNPEIPLHISRYFPSYKIFNNPTALHLIFEFYEIAKNSLANVYIGNVRADSKYSDTFCPKCGTPLISRQDYSIKENKLINSKCPECGKVIYGKFQ